MADHQCDELCAVPCLFVTMPTPPREAAPAGPKCPACGQVTFADGRHQRDSAKGPYCAVCGNGNVGASKPNPSRAAFVAQVREWLDGPCSREGMILMIEHVETANYAHEYGWLATLEALAEALRQEDK